MPVATLVAALFSVLVPSKMWYAPDQAIMVANESDSPVTLALVDFAGKRIEAEGPAELAAKASVDVRKPFPALKAPGAYVLLAVPKDKPIDQFAGTPLVIEIRENRRAGGAAVVRVAPLRYAVMATDQGDMTMIFWHDVAPNTAATFLSLASEGYFDGLKFHRVMPGFVIQGGDPQGTGTGGPGFSIPAEFSDRKHVAGVLSMARVGDPNEGPGMPPRPEFANSAGSQFFVCLDERTCGALDGKYTAFGQVVEGMETVNKIAATPLADQKAGRPVNPPVINKVQVKPVTAENNPYAAMLNLKPAEQKK